MPGKPKPSLQRGNWFHFEPPEVAPCTVWVRVDVPEDSLKPLIRDVLLEGGDDVEVTARMLKRLKLGRIEAQVAPLVLAERMAANAKSLAAFAAREGQDEARKLRAGARPDAFYVEVAEHYLELVSQTAAPAVALAAEYGIDDPAVVRGWIKEARRRGLLPAGRQGKAG